MSDKQRIHALRVLLATAASLHASASDRSPKDFKRSLQESIDLAAASTTATTDAHQIMMIALEEIARLPD